MPSLRRNTLLALLVSAPLLAYILYPALAMLAESLHAPLADWRAGHDGFDSAHQPWAAPLRALLLENGARLAFWGTLKLSLCTVVTGGLWGLGLALLWWRREFPGRRLFALLGYAPLLMPPLVGSMAFFRLLGEGGLLNRVFHLPGGKPLFSPFESVLILHTYAFGIYTYAFVAAALENLDHAHEEAARSLGGGPWAVFRHALWPAIRAPFGAAALLTFMAAGASFSAPLLLDTGGHYLTVEIVNEKMSGDPAFVSALTVLLAALSLAALPPFLYFQRSAPAAGAGLKGSAVRALSQAGRQEAAWRVGLSLAAAALLLAPLFVSALGAFTPKEDWYTGVWPKTLGLDAFRRLDTESLDALKRSVVYGLQAAALDLAVALAVALALRRASAWAGFPSEFAVMLAIALPGSAVAVALLAAFNGPSWLTGGAALGQSALILILAYASRCLPLAVRPARAALEDLGPDMELAARGLGASPLRTLARVVLPMILPALLAAGLLCFITAAGEFVASEILYGPATTPASVKINELFRNDPPGATALGLCLMALGAAAVGLSGWLQARASWRRTPRGDKL
ncbi:MAG: iron ABC transporter permease [Planctomycetes bacterium]|nr:iron ABC transporter permease [Planctomycetota bacterium]